MKKAELLQKIVNARLTREETQELIEYAVALKEKREAGSK